MPFLREGGDGCTKQWACSCPLFEMKGGGGLVADFMQYLCPSYVRGVMVILPSEARGVMVFPRSKARGVMVFPPSKARGFWVFYPFDCKGGSSSDRAFLLTLLNSAIPLLFFTNEPYRNILGPPLSTSL